MCQFCLYSHVNVYFPLTYCCQINLLPEYIIWNASNSFHISKYTTDREECCSLKLVPDLWEYHVSLLPNQRGKFCQLHAWTSFGFNYLDYWSRNNLCDEFILLIASARCFALLMDIFHVQLFLERKSHFLFWWF